MQHLGIKQVFSFDYHFSLLGFDIFPSYSVFTKNIPNA